MKIFDNFQNKNSDWINPLKLRFSVKIRDDTTPEMPQNGGEIVDLNKFPVLNKFGSEHSFNVSFAISCPCQVAPYFYIFMRKPINSFEYYCISI